MDLSLLQNFQTLVSTSLQSIVDDLKIQYENMREDLQDRITVLEEENEKAKRNMEELNRKLEESNFSEDNFNRVSIISNLNKQIKELRNENSDLRNCLNKNFPMNLSLARGSISDEAASVAEDELAANEVEASEVEASEVEASEVEANEVEANEVEANEVAANEVEANEVEANEVASEVEANEVASEVETELEEIEHKNKTYYLVNDELFTKKKNGKQGKCVGKMVNGKPKLNKKKKKVES